MTFMNSLVSRDSGGYVWVATPNFHATHSPDRTWKKDVVMPEDMKKFQLVMNIIEHEKLMA